MEFVHMDQLSSTPPNRAHTWKDISSALYDGLEVIPTRHVSPRTKSRNHSNCSVDVVDTVIKGNYASCMEKEIMEQPKSIAQTMLGRVDFDNFEVNLKGLDGYLEEIIRSRRIILIGAASSYHVALACRQTIEELSELPVFVELASDFLDREVPIFRDDVCILISQSGETSSVLKACLYCKKHDALVMGITNEENSRLSDETHFGISVNAGVEMGITSTKTYTSQFLVLVMFALRLAGDKKSKKARIQNIISEAKLLPEKIDKVLNLYKSLKQLAESLQHKPSILILGRGYQQATSLEGSFKFKEVVNIHSEGIHSGELKHGPLALICEEMPIIMIIMRDAIYDKCINAIEQVRARGGKPIVVCEEGDEATSNLAHTSICIPKTVDCLSGILAVIPFQLLAMHLAVLHGSFSESALECFNFSTILITYKIPTAVSCISPPFSCC
ncbi:glutamine--fructose-6-phosphate aminotransferase [isomerizing] 1-like [Hydractinia symbiolongicarpus]|uniref:glutamine--fructose-6-phosphate aminotransferase [isomerizing] 1-like n=1 Tax=Hydractinia symbiolongicarpus TaxID=13093 RepID=UPI002550819F|nr:glutamine--fructose-6-phosphate aminotransferase [isomerizing] 1-like [Hydractinia symbiolongicarpus]